MSEDKRRSTPPQTRSGTAALPPQTRSGAGAVPQTRSGVGAVPQTRSTTATSPQTRSGTERALRRPPRLVQYGVKRAHQPAASSSSTVSGEASGQRWEAARQKQLSQSFQLLEKARSLRKKSASPVGGASTRSRSPAVEHGAPAAKKPRLRAGSSSKSQTITTTSVKASTAVEDATSSTSSTGTVANEGLAAETAVAATHIGPPSTEIAVPANATLVAEQIAAGDQVVENVNLEAKGNTKVADPKDGIQRDLYGSINDGKDKIVVQNQQSAVKKGTKESYGSDEVHLVDRSVDDYHELMEVEASGNYSSESVNNFCAGDHLIVSSSTNKESKDESVGRSCVSANIKGTSAPIHEVQCSENTMAVNETSDSNAVDMAEHGTEISSTSLSEGSEEQNAASESEQSEHQSQKKFDVAKDLDANAESRFPSEKSESKSVQEESENVDEAMENFDLGSQVPNVKECHLVSTDAQRTASVRDIVEAEHLRNVKVEVLATEQTVTHVGTIPIQSVCVDEPPSANIAGIASAKASSKICTLESAGSTHSSGVICSTNPIRSSLTTDVAFSMVNSQDKDNIQHHVAGFPSTMKGLDSEGESDRVEESNNSMAVFVNPESIESPLPATTDVAGVIKCSEVNEDKSTETIRSQEELYDNYVSQSDNPPGKVASGITLSSLVKDPCDTQATPDSPQDVTKILRNTGSKLDISTTNGREDISDKSEQHLPLQDTGNVVPFSYVLENVETSDQAVSNKECILPAKTERMIRPEVACNMETPQHGGNNKAGEPISENVNRTERSDCDIQSQNGKLASEIDDKQPECFKSKGNYVAPSQVPGAGSKRDPVDSLNTREENVDNIVPRKESLEFKEEIHSHFRQEVENTRSQHEDRKSQTTSDENKSNIGNESDSVEALQGDGCTAIIRCSVRDDHEPSTSVNSDSSYVTEKTEYVQEPMPAIDIKDDGNVKFLDASETSMKEPVKARTDEGAAEAAKVIVGINEKSMERSMEFKSDGSERENGKSVDTAESSIKEQIEMKMNDSPEEATMDDSPEEAAKAIAGIGDVNKDTRMPITSIYTRNDENTKSMDTSESPIKEQVEGNIDEHAEETAKAVVGVGYPNKEANMECEPAHIRDDENVRSLENHMKEQVEAKIDDCTGGAVKANVNGRGVKKATGMEVEPIDSRVEKNVKLTNASETPIKDQVEVQMDDNAAGAAKGIFGIENQNKAIKREFVSADNRDDINVTSLGPSGTPIKEQVEAEAHDSTEEATKVNVDVVDVKKNTSMEVEPIENSADENVKSLNASETFIKDHIEANSDDIAAGAVILGVGALNKDTSMVVKSSTVDSSADEIRIHETEKTEGNFKTGVEKRIHMKLVSKVGHSLQHEVCTKGNFTMSESDAPTKDNRENSPKGDAQLPVPAVTSSHASLGGSEGNSNEAKSGSQPLLTFEASGVHLSSGDSGENSNEAASLDEVSPESEASPPNDESIQATEDGLDDEVNSLESGISKKPKRGRPAKPKLTDSQPRLSISQLKKTGRSFLQQQLCWKIQAKLPRCRECRAVVLSPFRTKQPAGMFCRFTSFRRLRYTRTGQLTQSGFCDPVGDAVDSEDRELWRARLDGSKTIPLSTAIFLLQHVSSQFCELFKDEESARLTHERRSAACAAENDEEHTDDRPRPIAWKRVVEGFREMCDVCETTLFNYHWVCVNCGFAACVDCYRIRHEGTAKVWDEAGNGRDEYRWLLCGGINKRQHKPEKMMLTQIVASDALTALNRQVHEARLAAGLPDCDCEEGRRAKENRGTVREIPSLAVPVDDKRPFVRGLSGSTGGIAGADATEPPVTKAAGSSLSFLADVALSESQMDSDNDDSDTDSDDSGGGDNTLRKLLFSNAGAEPAAKPKPTVKKEKSSKSGSSWLEETLDVLDKVQAHIAPQTAGSSLSAGVGSHSEPLRHFVRRVTSRRGLRERLPIRIMTLVESRRLYPGVRHSWLCDGKLLRLHDTQSEDGQRLFRDQWIRGQPVLVSEVGDKLSKDIWSVNSFIRDFGEVRNDLINCKTGNTVPNMPMRRFWEGFECVARRLCDERGQPMILKLKDWPPGEDFADMLPQRFDDLIRVLPMTDYTRRDGRLNLASCLPDTFVRPDLGPKMYIAYGCALHPSKASTNLHLDVSDAVNVMVHVGIPSDGDANNAEALRAIEEAGCDQLTKRRVKDELPGALWHIYHAADADKIRDLLNKIAIERGDQLEPHHDPIHDQSWYLDGPLRRRLYNEYAVEGYPIVQCAGDAVFIPAGAPHQVRNLHSCIKVAEDFVSPENIGHCFDLTQEFRSLSDTHTNHEDKLQIKNIIFHAMKEAVSAVLSEQKPADVNPNAED